MKIKDWATKDCEWWQFWYPQSGPRGGLFLGFTLGAILVIVCLVTGVI